MLPEGDTPGQSNGHAATRSNRSNLLAGQHAAMSGVTNGTHKTGASTNGSSLGDKANPTTAVQQPLSYFGHCPEEVTRLLIQALSDMGYRAAAEMVSRDSGFDLESPTVAAFRSAVLDGLWAEAEKLLAGAAISEGRGAGGNGLVLAAGSDRNVMKFWLRQQKFLELLEQRDTGRALVVLRGELTPLYQDTSKLHFLSSLLMCRNAEDLMAKANWDGARGQSRKQLLSELSRKLSLHAATSHKRADLSLTETQGAYRPRLCYRNTASPSFSSK